ncbi:hypothetical protein [Arthrospiribacter ruber]|uniref:Uncharacterized protein n=1 Tax=Arthrospiribacter ruber TaxID=2487934 RepID=A0A951MD39_9BACT|nr:hypothetical protein [Arthrospiribacter ruber]MBW3468639.1 hypothetical protein [Arthrospiribacter ruber]
MSKNHAETPKPKVPKWLKNVQRNSWEPEILLSGLVLIGLIQLPSKIMSFSLYFATEVSYNSWAGLFQAIQLAVYFLIFGLALHLFLRSVWVGLIGLTYTFPKGIKVEKLGYSSPFDKRVQNLPTLESQIIRLEKICSSIFAVCFFIMMVIIGVVVSSLAFIFVLYGLDWLFESVFRWNFLYFIEPYFDLILSWLLIFVAIDFITLGIYRKHRITAKLFYPVHRLVGWLTLSRVYRPIYYLFASNVRKIFLILFLAAFILSTLVGQQILNKRPDGSFLSQLSFYSYESERLFFSGYYADRNEAWESQILEIPSAILKGRFLEVRVKNRMSFEKVLAGYCGIDPAKADVETKLTCINDAFKILINNEQAEKAEWMFYFFSDSKRKGFVTFLDTEHLESGRHNLEVFLKGENEMKLANIVFFKEN